jgi:hypothetical protein
MRVMSRRRLAALVLLCSLPLVLPRGWCCIFAGPLKAALTKVAPSRPGCCPCTGERCRSCAGGTCCSCATQTPPADPGQPDTPRPVKHCPCADRDTTLSSGPEQGSPDLLPPEPLAELTLPVVALARFLGAVPAFPFHPPPLHVLKCLWLC